MPELSISRTVAAPREQVWRALTTEELAGWLWPPSFETTVSIDPSVGGRYRIESLPRDMAVSGEFRAVSEGKTFTESWVWDGESGASEVTVALSDAGESTELTLTHRGLAETDVANHIEGWNDCLDRLDEHLRA